MTVLPLNNYAPNNLKKLTDNQATENSGSLITEVKISAQSAGAVEYTDCISAEG